MALEDEGYESGSENFNMPTPLRKTPKINHVSSIENASFDPDSVTPCSTRQSLDAQVHLGEDVEEDIQMVPLDDEHWTTEEVPDRTLCIHEHALMHRLCPYPCPYANYLLYSYANTMDLSDIHDFEDIMIMSSDKDIPALEDPPY